MNFLIIIILRFTFKVKKQNTFRRLPLPYNERSPLLLFLFSKLDLILKTIEKRLKRFLRPDFYKIVP